MDSGSIQSYIIYRKKMALTMSLSVLASILLMLFCVYYLKSKVLAFVFLVITVFPLIFIRAVMKRFTRKISIRLQRNLFSVSITKVDEENKEYKEYPFSEISTYKVEFPNRKFSVIKFRLKQEKSIEYSFYKEKQSAEQTQMDDLLRSFQSAIKNYNDSVSSEMRIMLAPSFMASSYGLFCIILIASLLLVAVCIHILYQVKTLPITLFFGFTLLIQLTLRRRTDLEYYNKARSN